MEKSLIQKLSNELRIAPEQIPREYWELTFLNELSKEEWSPSLGFKGGTALRLAYGSPRFSDDLDFSIVGKLRESKLFSWAERIAQKFGVVITDTVMKRNTLLVEFRIRDNVLTQPIKQKLEVSTRETRSKAKDYDLRLLSSPVTNLQVLFWVASPELIWQEKLAALNDRREPRDLFDLWYLSQLLRQPLPTSLPTFPPNILKRTLNKYLPLKYHPVIKQLAKR